MIKIGYGSWLIALLLPVLIASCSTSSVTEQSPAETNVTPKSTMALSTIMPSTLTNTATTMTPTESPSTSVFQILAASDLAAQVEFQTWAEFQGTNVLLMLSSERTLQEGGIVSLDYLTWDGARSALVTFNLEPKTSVNAGLMTDIGTAALVWIFPQRYSERETYIVDFMRREIRGFKEACELSLTMGVGSKFVAFSCSEDRLKWYLLPNLNPVTFEVLDLPADTDPRILFYPVWLDSERIMFFEDFHNRVCTASTDSLDPVCKEFGFWLGPISPDGRRFEVRTGSSTSPDQVGVVGVDCIFQGEIRCTPRLQSLPTSIIAEESGTSYVRDSTWEPDSASVLYAVHVNTDRSTIQAERSEIWRYDIIHQTFERLYDLPGEQYFGDPRFELSPAPWSPDGKSVVVRDGRQISLLNIETGVLTPLTEGGVLLGTITLP